MAIEKRSLDVAKELDDVLVLFVNVMKAKKAGKSIAEIAAIELPDFMKALDGMSGIGDELKTNKAAVGVTIASRMGELLGVLTG